MFKVSLTECIIIGLVTIVCGFIIQYIVTTYGEEDVKDNNIFCRNKNKIWFYLTLFIIGILLHMLISYIDINNWQCEKICKADICNIVCTIPINNITNMLLTK